MGDVYNNHGYASRLEYLKSLAEDYGVALTDVLEMADLLGPNEDFDGLVSTLEDLQNL